MQANYVQRLRFTFSKTGPTRFIGHLDLARALERALNRGRIPVAYTQGFNRRPRMQFAAALPLGFTSECELADIWLAEVMAPEQAQQQLMSKMAPGIAIHTVSEVPLSEPALQTITAASVYAATITEPVDREALPQKMAALLAAESLIRTRQHGKKEKRYDLRPLVLDIKLPKSDDGTLLITMRLCQSPSKTGRPDELLRALDLDPLVAHIHRTQIVLAS